MDVEPESQLDLPGEDDLQRLAAAARPAARPAAEQRDAQRTDRAGSFVSVSSPDETPPAAAAEGEEGQTFRAHGAGDAGTGSAWLATPSGRFDGANAGVGNAAAPVTVPAVWPSAGEIVFDRVTLVYRPGLPPALRDFSARIAPGERIGIVGRTGAGKSSVLQVSYGVLSRSTCAQNVVRPFP